MCRWVSGGIRENDTLIFRLIEQIASHSINEFLRNIPKCRMINFRIEMPTIMLTSFPKNN